MPLFRTSKSTEPTITSHQMHPETAVGQLKAGAHTFPLQAVDVRGSVRGLLYSATVTQKFKNDRDTRLEAVYTFPLPPKAAVHGFTLTIGDRVIQGEIKERGAARREYTQAIASGHRAALMEEERSDIFTTTVGNIGPGEEIEIKFELSGPLSCFKNTARLRLPLVVGEVYIPGRALDGDSVGDGTSVDTDQVPDASRITPPRLTDGAPNPVSLSVSFTVEPSGLQLTGVVSTCHFARTKKFQDGRYRVSLLPGVERMDRAFVLEITYPENTLQTSLLWDPDNKAFALTVVPPVALDRKEHSRDVVILLDRSGSMGGWPMVAARRAAARIVESLTEADRFGIVSYDDRNEHFDVKQGLCSADNFHKMRAAEYLSKIDARGGTEMLPALQEGLRYFGTTANRDPHVILITDGDVGNDSSLIRSCQTGVRISTVGIGYAAREGLLNRMAETSGGLCSLIPNEADLEKELVEMHRKWGQPIWKGLSLRGQDENLRSPKFWDVWQDVPTTFFGKADLESVTQVSGWFADRGYHSEEVSVVKTDDPVVYRAWARSRLLDLEDLFLVNRATPAELVGLSVSAQVLCRFTAFTAVDKTEKLDTKEEMQRIVQPVEQTIAKDAGPRKVCFGMLDSDSVGGSSPCDMELADACYSATADVFGQAGEPPEGGAVPASCFAPAPGFYDDADYFDDADYSIEMEEAAPPAPPARGGGFLGRILGGTRSRQSQPKPKASPHPARPQSKESLKQQASDSGSLNSDVRQLMEYLLNADELLKHGDVLGTEVLNQSLKVVTHVLDSLSAILRAQKFDETAEQRLKALLTKLHDYREALEEALNGEPATEALKIRREIENVSLK